MYQKLKEFYLGSKGNINFILISMSATVISGLLNYLFHPLMLNYLTSSEFAQFGSLVGIFNILGVISSGITLFLVKEISRHHDNYDKIKSIFINSNNILLIGGIIIYLIFICFSPLIANFLKFDSVLPIILIGFIIIISFEQTIIVAIIQGLKKFNFLAIISIIGPIIKIGIGLIFIYGGIRLYGAIGSFLMSGITSAIISFGYVFYLLRAYPTVYDIKNLLVDFYKQFGQIFQLFLLVLILAIYQNLDIIYAKHIFAEDIAGIYVGLAILAKFISFLGMTIETVYYPQIMQYTISKLPRHLLQNSLILLILVIIGALLGIGILGKYILNIIKPGFGQYLMLFILMIIYSGEFCILSLYSKILVGWQEYHFTIYLGIMLFILIALLELFVAHNMYNFALILIGIFSLLSIGLGIMIYIKILRRQNFKSKCT